MKEIAMVIMAIATLVLIFDALVNENPMNMFVATGLSVCIIAASCNQRPRY